jgi:hypothetical protein
VQFFWLIGAVIVFHFRWTGGNLCTACIHKVFWEYTLITLGLGWWGWLSFLLTPLVLLHNVIRYAWCLGMPRAPQA